VGKRGFGSVTRIVVVVGFAVAAGWKWAIGSGFVG
jgi:hypothetical protein